MPDPMTKEDIVNEVKALRTAGVSIGPEEIFGRDELEKVDFVKDYRKKLQNQNSAFERKQKDFDVLEETKTKHQEEIEEKDKTIDEFKLKVAKIDAKDKFFGKDGIATKRNLTPKQIEFFQSQWDEFKPDDPEKLDDSLNQFADSGIEKFKKSSEFFGFKEEGGETTPGDQEGGEKASPQSGDKDKPNPFISK